MSGAQSVTPSLVSYAASLIGSHLTISNMRPSDEQSPIPDITDDEMRRTVVMVRRELVEIKTALIGNDLGTPGIVPRLDSVEEKTNNNARLLAIVSGALILLSVTIVFIKDVRDLVAK